MKYFFLLWITSFALYLPTYPGVYLLINLPEEVQRIVNAEQEKLEQDIQKINAQQNSSYAFDAAKFSPHISLAFVSQEQLSVDQTKQKFAGLSDELTIIAQQFNPTDISNVFKHMSRAYWQGKFEVACGGSKKKNYINAILKATPNEPLAALSATITTMLQQKYDIKQAFPFSIHLTLGRIYDINDQPINTTFDTKNIEQQDTAPLIVKAFTLKGHDGSEAIFNLSLS